MKSSEAVGTMTDSGVQRCYSIITNLWIFPQRTVIADLRGNSAEHNCYFLIQFRVRIRLLDFFEATDFVRRLLLTPSRWKTKEIRLRSKLKRLDDE